MAGGQFNTLFRRAVTLTLWQESVPKDPTNFNPTKTTTQVDIKDMRVQFKIDKGLTKAPNVCEIIVTNLNPASRALCQARPLLVRIAAGYEDEQNLLFEGDVRFSMSELKHPDWETMLQLGEDDCHHRWSRVNRSFKPGTTIRTVLANAAKSAGYTVPASLDSVAALDQQFVSGTASFGPVRDELTRLLTPLGYTWSVQNGQLQILTDTSVSSLNVIPLGEAYGMIGTPEFGSPPRSGKPAHVKVKMLLYPKINPGNLVHLYSSAKSGLFRVEKVRHEGDTHGESWFTEIEIAPAAGNIAGNDQVADQLARLAQEQLDYASDLANSPDAALESLTGKNPDSEPDPND